MFNANEAKRTLNVDTIFLSKICHGGMGMNHELKWRMEQLKKGHEGDT